MKYYVGGLMAVATVSIVASCGKGLFVPCSVKSLEKGGNCGCQIALPVNTALLVPHGGTTIWPWGVHGEFGHQEGHPGIDFISTVSIPVYAVADGTVSKIEGPQLDEYVATSNVVYVQADCGIEYDYQPVVLDSSISVGTRVSRGQQIGVMAEMVAPYGPGRFSFHFDTRGEPSGSKYRSWCPATFVSPADQATLQAMVDASTYDEKVARTKSIACKDGSSRNFSYPAENKVCNAHLDSATAEALDACLQLGSERPVW